MVDLTLPGSIPGLLRRGSPVLVAPVAATPRKGVVIDFAHKPTGAMVLDDYLVARGAKMPRNWMSCNLLLDLTDATGRTHAAWWLMGLDYGGISPLRAIASPVSDHCAVAIYGWPQVAGWASCRVPGHPVGTIVPALATLDPNDPRLLPDGSRWVDAEALRLVCLHVAGLEVTHA